MIHDITQYHHRIPPVRSQWWKKLFLYPTVVRENNLFALQIWLTDFFDRETKFKCIHHFNLISTLFGRIHTKQPIFGDKTDMAWDDHYHSISKVSVECAPSAMKSWAKRLKATRALGASTWGCLTIINGKRVGTSSYVWHTSSISGVYKRGIRHYFCNCPLQ